MVGFHVGDVRLQGLQAAPCFCVIWHAMHLFEVAVKKIGPVLANWNKKHAFDLKEMYHVEAASIEPCCRTDCLASVPCPLFRSFNIA